MKSHLSVVSYPLPYDRRAQTTRHRNSVHRQCCSSVHRFKMRSNRRRQHSANPCPRKTTFKLICKKKCSIINFPFFSHIVLLSSQLCLSKKKKMKMIMTVVTRSVSSRYAQLLLALRANVRGCLGSMPCLANSPHHA